MEQEFSGLDSLGWFFFSPNNRDWLENTARVAFLEAATDKADQHMADRPPQFPSHAYTSTEGTGSQNVSPIFHLAEPVLSSFGSVFTRGKINEKTSRAGSERVEKSEAKKKKRQRVKSRHQSLRIVWNSLLSYKLCWLSDLLSNCPGARPRERSAGTPFKKKKRKKRKERKMERQFRMKMVLEGEEKQ